MGDATAASPIGGNKPRLRLLGAPELRKDSVVRFLPERRFRLLAFLALRAEWVSRDELATLFWPDRPQDAARSNLRKLLLEVRALDPPQLELDRNGVRWNVSTDVAALRSALARGDYSAALTLYSGPFAHGLDGGDSESFTRWLSAERHHLHATGAMRWRTRFRNVRRKRR
jgi:DNA-binding SARP family transcriptional activator